MRKVFEDYFSEIQSDMISICLEYIENRAEKIFIYCSFEDNVIQCFFYKINGKILKKNKVNDGIKTSEEPFDISSERQKVTIMIINDEIKKLVKLCSEYKRDMPTQIKLVYDVSNNSVNTDYQYDFVFSKVSTKTAYDILEE